MNMSIWATRTHSNTFCSHLVAWEDTNIWLLWNHMRKAHKCWKMNTNGHIIWFNSCQFCFIFIFLSCTIYWRICWTHYFKFCFLFFPYSLPSSALSAVSQTHSYYGPRGTPRQCYILPYKQPNHHPQHFPLRFHSKVHFCSLPLKQNRFLSSKTSKKQHFWAFVGTVLLFSAK